jgi:hypothetical protein
MINEHVVQIEEILGRARQGRTQPFICRATDGRLYYVKGRHAGRRGQIVEWIGSCLAARFGLPVAQSVVVEIDPSLVAIAPLEYREIGSGLAFGSLACDDVVEIALANLGQIPDTTKADVLVFDWWVMNSDRILTEFGGNPNLLWNTLKGEVVVIDHNLALDGDFDAKEFLASHIFRAEWSSVTEDWVVRAQYEDRLKTCYSYLEEILDKMPDEWYWVDDGVRAPFSKADAEVILSRCNDPQSIWRVAR